MGWFSRAMGIPDPPRAGGGEDGYDDSGEAQDAHKRQHRSRKETKKFYDRQREKLEREQQRQRDKKDNEGPRDGKLW